MTKFDLDGFVSTLIATLIGAAVALAGSFWLERSRVASESSERYQERLDSLLFKVVEGLGDRLQDLHGRPGTVWQPPQTVFAAIDTARMVGRGDDAETLKQMKLAMGRVADVEDFEDQYRDTRVIGQILRAWREGSTTSAKASERFSGVCPPS